VTGGYQDLARKMWRSYADRRVLFAGPELLVCEWRCHGEERSWSREVTPDGELDLPRLGMHVRALGRRQHVIDPAGAAFSAAGDEYQRASPTSRPATSTLIALRGEHARALIPRHRGRSHRVSARAARLHLHLLRAADPVALEETALDLVRSILTPGAPADLPGAVSPAWRRLSQEIQHVIATCFAERLTLQTIGRLCKASPFHASRVFRAVTGETIHRRLTRVRLQVALFELERGAGRLSQVALSAGFSSHSHFTSSFRAEFGVSPSGLLAASGRGSAVRGFSE
jgi:AraC-like DNA-binding protein